MAINMKADNNRHRKWRNTGGGGGGGRFGPPFPKSQAIITFGAPNKPAFSEKPPVMTTQDVPIQVESQNQTNAPMDTDEKMSVDQMNKRDQKGFTKEEPAKFTD